MTLEQLGGNARVRSRFATYAERGWTLGRVYLVQRGEYGVYLEDEERRAECAGSLLYEARSAAELPAVGDWVAMDGPLIRAVLPRGSRFSRQAAGEKTEEQVVAANVDIVFLVCGLDHDFNPRRVERYLTLAWESGARPVILLNKADVCAEAEERAAEVMGIAPGVTVLTLSALTGMDVDSVRELVRPGVTVALLGSSGVGKSTLVNQLLGYERQRTCTVRESDSRGRHTTTYRELIVLPKGGVLIDTPGLRELQLWASAESVERTFVEIAELARACRFRDCSHDAEEGCAVRGVVSEERLESFRKLMGEVAYQERKVDVRAALEQKRMWKELTRAARAAYKLKGKKGG